MKLGVPPGVTACEDICVRVAIGAGMAESIPSSLRDLLFLKLRAEPPGQ